MTVAHTIVLWPKRRLLNDTSAIAHPQLRLHFLTTWPGPFWRSPLAISLCGLATRCQQYSATKLLAQIAGIPQFGAMPPSPPLFLLRTTYGDATSSYSLDWSLSGSTSWNWTWVPQRYPCPTLSTHHWISRWTFSWSYMHIIICNCIIISIWTQLSLL